MSAAYSTLYIQNFLIFMPFISHPRAPLKKLATAKALAQLIFSPKHYRPAQALPIQSPDWQKFLSNNPQAQFIWFGHSSLLSHIEGKTIFFDPVFARFASPVPVMAKRFQAPPATLAQLPPIDWIVISHNHYDHLDYRAICFFARQSCQFAVPFGLAPWLKKRGIVSHRIHEMHWWQALELSTTLSLHALPSLHYSGRGILDKDQSLTCSYALISPNEKFYFSGDSFYADGEHFSAIGNAFSGFTLAFIENGQYHSAWRDNHMFPSDTIQAALNLQAQRFMPIHWGAYALSPHSWNAPVIASITQAQALGLNSLTPYIGEVFSADSHSTAWWQTSA